MGAEKKEAAGESVSAEGQPARWLIGGHCLACPRVHVERRLDNDSLKPKRRDLHFSGLR